MIRLPPRSPRTDTLLPSTTLVRLRRRRLRVTGRGCVSFAIPEGAARYPAGRQGRASDQGRLRRGVRGGATAGLGLDCKKGVYARRVSVRGACRSEGRRGGEGCVSKFRYWWSPAH